MPAPIGNNNAIGNKGGGRNPEYQHRYAAMAEKIALLGATDAILADIFEVSEQTINNWKNEYIEFSLALKKGKTLADSKVALSLFKRANGYSHPDVDIKMYEGIIITTKLKKYYPPDTMAAMYWLNNRQKQFWRTKHEFGITDKEGNDIKHPSQILILPPNEVNRFEIKEGE